MSDANHSQISREKLVELCSRAAYTLDGLWFTVMEDKYGLDAALEVDIEVWRSLGAIEAKRVQKYFDIDEGSPIRTLIKVVEVDPLLAIYKPKTLELSDDRAVLCFTDCPPQKARIRNGRGQFPCKGIGLELCVAYAAAIDPRIQTSCLACPPGKRAREGWCEGLFEIV